MVFFRAYIHTCLHAYTQLASSHPDSITPPSQVLLNECSVNIGLHWIPRHDLTYFSNLKSNRRVLLGRVQGTAVNVTSIWTFCQWGSKKVSMTANWMAYWGYRRGLVKCGCCQCHPLKTNDFSRAPQLWNRPVLSGDSRIQTVLDIADFPHKYLTLCMFSI